MLMDVRGCCYHNNTSMYIFLTSLISLVYSLRVAADGVLIRSCVVPSLPHLVITTPCCANALRVRNVLISVRRPA